MNFLGSLFFDDQSNQRIQSEYSKAKSINANFEITGNWIFPRFVPQYKTDLFWMPLVFQVVYDNCEKISHELKVSIF